MTAETGETGESHGSAVRPPPSLGGESSQPPSHLKDDGTGHLSDSSESIHSNGTDDSDPLEPLELALTPQFETQEEIDAREPVSHVRTATSIGSSASRPPDFEVTFEENDPENPHNWPLWYRCWLLLAVSYSTWVVVVYSTSYTSSIPGLMASFHESNEAIATLGLTAYLLGLATGSVLLAPMSELFGRRPVYLICIACFTLLVLPAALAKSLAGIIVVRYFGALFGAALISNSPATVVDISREEHRALYISLVSIAPLNGPVTGPIIGGFVYEYMGWRWDNWVVLILAGAAVLIMATVKETYAPAILKAKAARMRKETGDDRYWCRYDQKISITKLLKLNMSRPFILSLTEPILWFFNVWISIVYGILYLCFVAYPIVFRENRGWSSGMSGLSFLGIGIGTMMAVFSEPLCRRLINNHEKDPETGRAPPEASARVMLLGSILTPIGQLVFSWTCLPASIHWAIPIAFGIPFGAGNTLTFIYGSNYLAGSYGIYAASALAGNAVVRSIFGGTLPLAGATMYAKMTPQWAGTFLGLLEVCLIPIPIIFLRYGKQIRARSRVIRQMQEDLAKNENRRAKQMARLQRKKDREAAEVAAEAMMEAEDMPETAERDVEKGVVIPTTVNDTGKQD